MSTPLSEILSLVAAHGKSQASAFNQGEQSFTGTPQEEIVEFVSRQDVEWDSLPIADRDRIYDEYIQAVQQEMARRLVSSDPVTSPLPVSVAQDDGCAVCGEVAIPFGPGICPKCRNPYRVIMAEDAFSEIETPSPTSSVVPAPLVPEVVKEALEGISGDLDYIWESSNTSNQNADIDDEIYFGGIHEKATETRRKIESALTALRNYSPAPSPSVELLREAKEGLEDLNYCNCDASYNQEHRPDCSKIWVPQLISKINAELA